MNFLIKKYGKIWKNMEKYGKILVLHILTLHGNKFSKIKTKSAAKV